MKALAFHIIIYLLLLSMEAYLGINAGPKAQPKKKRKRRSNEEIARDERRARESVERQQGVLRRAIGVVGEAAVNTVETIWNTIRRRDQSHTPRTQDNSFVPREWDEIFGTDDDDTNSNADENNIDDVLLLCVVAVAAVAAAAQRRPSMAACC